MTDFQILLLLFMFTAISLVVFIYLYKKKLDKRIFDKKLRQSKHVSEHEKIRVYLDNINEATRAKHRKI